MSKTRFFSALGLQVLENSPESNLSVSRKTLLVLLGKLALGNRAPFATYRMRHC